MNGSREGGDWQRLLGELTREEPETSVSLEPWTAPLGSAAGGLRSPEAQLALLDLCSTLLIGMGKGCALEGSDGCHGLVGWGQGRLGP